MKEKLQPVIFVSIVKNNDPKTPVSLAYPANIIIPTTAWIDDPERGNVLIQYIKGEKSIYAYTGQLGKDGKPLVEQTKDAKPKKELIIMSRGQYTCDPREKTLIEYLEKSYCEGAKLIDGSAIYRKRDAVKSAAEGLKKIYADNDLINAVRSMTAVELACLSFIMGDKNAYNEEAETNRWNLTVAAKNTPDKLKAVMENPKTERKAKISLAEFDNIITIDRKDRIIKWAGGDKITTVPIGMDALDYMVDMSFQPLFSDVYQAICNKLKPEIKERPETQNPIIPEKGKDAEFVENCLSSGVLVKKTGGWFSVADAQKGDPYRGFHQGNNSSVIQYLNDNPELKKHLEEKLSGVVV